MDDDPAYSPSDLFSGGRSGLLPCFCQGHCPGGAANGTCYARPGAKCFAAVEEVLDQATGQLVPERTYGCMPPEDESGLLQCKGHLVPHLNPTSIACCSDAPFCNKRLLPMYQATRPVDEENGLASSDRNGLASLGASLDNTTLLALLVTLALSFIVIVILIAYGYLRLKKREDRKRKYFRTSQHDPDAFSKQNPGTLSELLEKSSGSGSGLPSLVQRTIAKQICIESAIGRGRYGEVWRAKWRDENVAVKIFFTFDEVSWLREIEIYQTVMMRHDNILRFIAADIKGTGSWTQMLLITDYHENGSLHDFLKQNTLDSGELFRLCHSLSCGLDHLHTEVPGHQGKPPIAHRDLKSSNILVKSNMTCAIADFGLAVRFNSETNAIDLGPPNPRVGTFRYMAPEELSKTMNTASFQAYLQADMYSAGLVFWEMARRTFSGENKEVMADDYQLPFYEYVVTKPDDNRCEEMLNIVYTKQLRPNKSPRWKSCPILHSVSKLMSECWHENPSARPSSLRVKKTLSNAMPEEDPSRIKVV